MLCFLHEVTLRNTGNETRVAVIVFPLQNTAIFMTLKEKV